MDAVCPVHVIRCGCVARAFRYSSEPIEEEFTISRVVKPNDRTLQGKDVRVVGPEGDQLGIMKIELALSKAQEAGYDLVIVADNAEPAVCRIMDYGKHSFEQKRRERENKRKQHANRTKEVKFRVNIDAHDYKIKIQHIVEFLGKGNRVKVSLQFRGRENAHREIGMQLMDKVIEDVKGTGIVDAPPRLQGRSVSMQLAPDTHK